jgi:hypothetical protein
MKILLLALALTLAPLYAGAECVYLAGSTVVRSLVVLDAADFTEHFAIDGAGGVLSRGLVVRGNYAYVNYEGFADPSGDHLILPGRIFQVHLLLRRVTAEIPTGRGNFDLAYANGKLYTPNALEDTVTVVDLESGSTRTIPGVGDFPTDVAATPDGARVLVSDQASGYVTVIDTETDQIALSFYHGLAAFEILASDEEVFVGTGFGLLVFRREGESYVESWFASLGFSFGYALAGRGLYSVSRGGVVQVVSLDEPHETISYRIGAPGGRLLGIVEHEGLLYIAGEGGFFRFSPEPATWELLYPGSYRAVAIAPCPRIPSTFPGDANCDEALTEADAEATLRAFFDEEARVRCDADCNQDGRVDAADLGCVALGLAAS